MIRKTTIMKNYVCANNWIPQKKCILKNTQSTKTTMKKIDNQNGSPMNKKTEPVIKNS